MPAAPKRPRSDRWVDPSAAGPRIDEHVVDLRRAAKPGELERNLRGPARKEAAPGSDTRGSAEFKKEMAGVLVARALVSALERLGVGGMA